MEKTVNKNRNLLMLGGVVAVIISIVIFNALGGGTPIEEENAYSQEYNAELPEAAVGTVTDDKLLALQEEQIREEKAKLDGTDGSSFGLLEGTQQSSGVNVGVRNELDDRAAELQKQLEEQQQHYQSEMARLEEQKNAIEQRRQKVQGGGSASTQKSRKVMDIEQTRLNNQRMVYKQLQDKYGKERYPDMDNNGNPVEETRPKEEDKKVAEAKPLAKKSQFNTLGKSNTGIGHDIRAVVHGNHRNLTENSQVKLRLLDPMVINGVTVEKNSFIYGKVSFANARMEITIDNINYRDNVLPFKGEIFDTDGTKGIYVPGNAISSAASEAGGNSVSGAETRVTTARSGSLVQTGINGVNSGVNAIKSAVQKKTTENKVSISANYKVTIREKKN